MNSIKPGPKQVKNVFGFLDESGLLHTPKTDRVFALALLKLQHPSVLHRQIIKYKQKHLFFQEFKFSNLTNKNFSLYRGLIDLFFGVPNSYFHILVFDKNKVDIKRYHNNNQFKAYNAFVARLIADCLDSGEYISMIADDVTTPKDDNFEREIRYKVKRRLRRNALFGIVRAESHSFSELQITDLLLGIVAYAFKVKYKVITPNDKTPKLRLVKHLQKKLSISILSEFMNRKMRFGRIFKIEEFAKSSIPVNEK